MHNHLKIGLVLFLLPQMSLFISTEEVGLLTWSGFSTHGGTFSKYRPVDIPLPASQCLVKHSLAFYHRRFFSLPDVTLSSSTISLGRDCNITEILG